MHVLIKRKLEGPSIPELGQPTSATFDSVTVPLNRPTTGPSALAAYELQRSLNGTTWETIATGPGIFGNPAAQYVDGGRAALTLYFYRARATDTAGRVSDFCAPASVTTQAGTETSELPRFNTATPTKIVNAALTANNITIFKTIQAAVDAAVPGDVIAVAPGRYFETLLVEKDGSAAAPIYIQAQDPSNKPIIDGQMVRPSGLMRNGAWYRLVAISASNIVWDSIDIINSAVAGLTVGPSAYNNSFFLQPEQINQWFSNVRIYRTRIEKCNNAGFACINTDGVTFGGGVVRETCRGSDAEWENTVGPVSGWTSAMRLMGKNVSVVESVVAQALGEGVTAGGHVSMGVGAFIQVENFILRNCRVFDTWAGQLYVNAINGGTIERNIIYQTGDTRFWYGRASNPGYPLATVTFASEAGRGPEYNPAGWSTGFIGGVNVNFQNNVVSGSICLLGFGGERNQVWDNIKIRHNTFYGAQPGDSPTFSGVFLNGNTPDFNTVISNLTLENNIIYDASGRMVCPNPGWAPITGPLIARNNLWSHTPPAALQGTNDIVNSSVGLTNVDYVPVGPWPSISEFDATSFRLIPSSPAINAGASSAGVNNDFFGTPRGGTPDIGAHELT